jgi:hypothetical protein
MTTRRLPLRLVANSVAFVLAASAADVALAQDTAFNATCAPLLTR